MQRRAFVGRLATGIGAAGWLPGIAMAAAQQVRSLADDLRATRDSQEYWRRVKEEFILKPGLIHLNTGSLGAAPRSVVEVLTSSLYQLEADPVSNEFGAMGVQMEAVRTKAAEFLGAAPDEMVVTDNTTEGMNTVAAGIKLKAGDEILTTNHEHPGGLVCWQFLAKHHGIKVVQVPMPAPARDKGQILEQIKSQITPRTKVCSVQHVDTITGTRMPVAEISELTRPQGILLVCDGAQAPGMLKIDVKALGVDAYASSSHKWLLAPKGSGLLYIRKDVQDRIQPLLLHSGYQVYTASSGTRNLPHVLAHGAAIDFHNTIGREKVEARCRSLCNHLRRRLCEIPALQLLTTSEDAHTTGMVVYGLKSAKSQDIHARLYKEHDIVVKHVPKDDYNALRFSTHVYNTEEELDRTADLLATMLRG